MAEQSPYDAAFVEDEQEELELNFGPISENVLGLVMVGALRDQVSVAGHTVAIRTLKIGEELEASLLSNKYRDTDDSGRAYATAVVAACIESVDGKPLTLQQIGPNESVLDSKYNYILANWYWTSIRVVYEAYLGLLTKANEALAEVKKD
jgi:hypothetical protein